MMHSALRLLLIVGFLAMPVQVGATEVAVALAADGVRVTFTVAPNCPSLHLRGAAGHPIAVEQRSRWRATRGCARLDGDAVVFSDPRVCATETFIVPMSATIMDRRYPQAFPVGDDGVVVYSDYIAPTPECGDPRLVMTPPLGGFAFADGRSSSSTAIDASLDGAGFSAFVGRSAPALSVDGIAVASGGAVPAWALDSLPSTLPVLTRALGLASSNRSLFIAFAGVQTGQGGPRLQADVTRGGFLRFALVNYPEQPSPADRQRLWVTIAHELSHLAQPSIRDHLLLEGGAEYLALSITAMHGLVTPDFARDYLRSALNDCLLTAGELSIDRLAGVGGSAPYTCGLALHFLLHALSGSADDGLAWLMRTYRQTDGRDLWPALSATIAPEVFRRDAPVRRFIEHATIELGIGTASTANECDATESPDPRWESALKRHLFGTLMQRACGQRSFNDHGDRIVVGPLPTACDGLQEGQVIEAIADQPWTRPASQIWRATAQSCTTRRVVELSGPGRSPSVIGCEPMAAPPTRIRDVPIERVGVLQGRR